MILETDRLVLRPWREEDAADLYELAKHPKVGPITGWPVHTNIQNSLEVIQSVLSEDETYALIEKGTDSLIGDIGLMIGPKSKLDLPPDEAEIGYWLGVNYWGRGYMPEAVEKIIDYSFNTLNLSILWCGYYIENNNSKRVSEKVGFLYHHTEEVYVPLINETKTLCVTQLKQSEWTQNGGTI